MKRFTALLVAMGWCLSGCSAGGPPEARAPRLVSASLVAASDLEPDYLGRAELRAAEPLHAPEPEYPEAERVAGVEAKVVVHYQVSEHGRVVNARADGPAAFRAKALEALANWRFQPATRDGAPLRSRRATEFVFRVKG